MLVEPIVFVQHRSPLGFQRGDGAEQIPQAFKVVFHLAAAADDEALLRVLDAVAGAAGQA